MDTEVLIVGAGPTGLVLALWLAKQGVKVRIIDKNSGPGTTSRAMTVQARTLELYRQMDLAETVVAAGHKNPVINLWAGGKRKAALAMGEVGKALTPYPFMLVYPQDEHEKLLVDKLQSLGVVVERHTELLSIEDHGDKVTARLCLPDGSEQVCTAMYLAGCDGVRSTVRSAIGGGFEGGTYKQVFYVADVQISGLEPREQTHIVLDSSDFVAILSYGQGQNRLIGTVADERAQRAETLTFEDIGHAAIKGLGIKVEKVNWFSTYHVHHRLTDHFRKGRVMVSGDAAHVHSPAGGQGMNTGISDAINLAWKLAAIIKGKAEDRILDSYEAERRAFALKLVDTTDRMFSFITAEGSFANFVRTHIAPTLMGFAYKFDTPRQFMFRMISQTALNYCESKLSEGVAGKVRGGDRLPWVSLPDSDNYAPLSTIGWQVHVYGAAKPELKAWCEAKKVTLHVFNWHVDHGKAGFARDAVYLLRPDTYVAMADPQGAQCQSRSLP